MDPIQRELILLTVPLPCLTVQETRRAIRIARKLGRLAAERGDAKAKLATFRQWVKAAEVAGVLADAAALFWESEAASVDVRVLAFKDAFALAKAGA